MGTYEELKTAIQQVIRTNGNNEITGAMLQNALLSIVNVVGANATFAGIATPNTNPGTADQNVFYLATEAGVYVNFGGIVIDTGKAVIISNKTGQWVKHVSGFATEEKVAELANNVNVIINGGSRIETITEFSDKGKFLYENTVLESAQYNITEYITINEVTQIILTDLWASTTALQSYVIYDDNKNVLAKNSTPSATGLVSYVLKSEDLPSGAYYIRCTQNRLYQSSVQLFFEDTGIKPRLERVEKKNKDFENRIEKLESELEPKKDEFNFVVGQNKNLITDFTTYSAQHLNTTNGQLVANDKFTTSEFIKVDANKTYCAGVKSNLYGGYISTTMQEICYYDNNKQFLSAEISKSVITTPFNTAYIRIAVLSTLSSIGDKGVDDIKELEVVEGNTPISVFSNDIFSDIMPKNPLLLKKWLIIGDSNTEHNARATAKYDEFIASATGVIPTNIGKSGAGYRVYQNTNYVFLNILNNFFNANSNYTPDFITIMGGSNDVVYDYENVGNIDDVTDATIFGCIHILTERIKEIYPTIPFAIITPFPHNYEKTEDNIRLEEFVDNLKQFCKKKNIPCLDLLTCSGIRPTEPIFNKKYFSSPASPDGDGLHLNFYGQKIISSRIREFILQYFGEF